MEMVAARKEVSYPELLDYIQMVPLPKSLPSFPSSLDSDHSRWTQVTPPPPRPACDLQSYSGTTIAQETRFYDDKETYTGVHKAGGPTVVDRDKQGLESLLDRSDADVRGLKRVSLFFFSPPHRAQDMKEAHGRQMGSGSGSRREMAEHSHSPQAQYHTAPVPSSAPQQRSARAAASPRDNSHDAIIENLENRLKRATGAGSSFLALLSAPSLWSHLSDPSTRPSPSAATVQT
jgi:hypothetical protein